MKKRLFVMLMSVMVVMGFTVESGFKGRPIEDIVVMPTGYTLGKGEFTLGLGSIGYGLSDQFQLGTNVLLFLFQDYNVNAKFSFFKTENNALALGLSLHHFDLPVFDADEQFTAFSPYISYSSRIGEKTMLHIGGQYSHYSGDFDIGDAKASITSAGSSASLGVEYDLGKNSKAMAETGYDLTFKGFRVGGALLFGWTSFRLKLGVNYFAPNGDNNYIMPVIGLWWRFDG